MNFGKASKEVHNKWNQIKKCGKSYKKKNAHFITIFHIIYEAFFSVGQWSLGSWAETLAEKQGRAKLVGAGLEGDSGPASAWKGSVGRAREGWETFFLLSPFSPYHV